MQISTLRTRLEECKRDGRVNYVVGPRFPAASNEDYLFDCMNLYARLKEDGQVVVEGVVFYDDDTHKSAVIRSFKDLNDCLAWIGNEYAAGDECVKVLNENC